MREYVKQYLDHDISRRGFMRSVANLGLSTVAAKSILDSLQPLEAVAAPLYSSGEVDSRAVREFEGTGGEVLVETLRSAGVEYIFTNPGSMERGFFDALADSSDMQLIMGLHEGIVLAIADGYYKVARKPTVVNVHTMVGTAQMLGQLYNAGMDGSGILVTAGMIDNNVYSDDVINGAPPGYSQGDLPRQITKMSWEVQRPENIALATYRGLKVALTQPCGPTYIAYSDTALEAANVRTRIMQEKDFLIPGRIRASQQLVDEAAGMLINAKKPVLYLGDEIGKSGAEILAVELAELLSIPVMVSSYSRIYNTFPSFHPLNLGGYSPHNDYLQDADLLFIFSGRWFGLSSEMIFTEDNFNNKMPALPIIPPGAKSVQVGLNAVEIGRNHKVDLPVFADPGEMIRDLITAIKSRLTGNRIASIRESRLNSISQYTEPRRKAALNPSKEGWDSEPINSSRFAYEVVRHIDKDAIVLSENGAPLGGYLNASKQGHCPIGITGGSLGWSPGAAIGAQLAAPDRMVVCNLGDGAVMYSASAFWAQARYGTPILTIVNNNRNYETIRSFYHRYQGKMAKTGKYPCSYLGDPDIDYVQLAESQGVEAERVTRPKEITAALKRGIKATRDGRPYLIEGIVARRGGGAESTWHSEFKLTSKRTRRT